MLWLELLLFIWQGTNHSTVFTVLCGTEKKSTHQIIHDNSLLKQASLQRAVVLQWSSFSLLGRL